MYVLQFQRARFLALNIAIKSASDSHNGALQQVLSSTSYVEVSLIHRPQQCSTAYENYRKLPALQSDRQTAVGLSRRKEREVNEGRFSQIVQKENSRKVMC